MKPILSLTDYHSHCVTINNESETSPFDDKTSFIINVDNVLQVTI